MRLQKRDRLRLRQACRQHLADDAVEDDVRRIADDLRPDDGEGDAADAEDGDNADERKVRPQPAKQLAQGLARVIELGRRRSAHAHPPTGLAPLRGRPSGSLPVDHATAASPSWESTISR